MKTTIIIEDGRVTVQVDDGQAVEVKPKLSTTLKKNLQVVDKGGVQIEPPLTIPPEPQRPEAPSGLVLPTPKIISPVPSSTDSDKTLPTDDRKCEECGGSMAGRPSIAKICGSDACKKSRAKKQNEEMRRRKGQAVGVGRGRKRKPSVEDPGKFALQEDTSTPLPTDSAPEQEPEFRSKCCDGVVSVNDDDEPVCKACGNTCEIYEKPFEDPWNCGACRGYGRLCGLHFNLERDGRKPPQFVHQI